MDRKVLKSIVGDSAQEHHTDFVMKEMEGLEKGKFSFSVLAPLNHAVKLHIGDKVVAIDVGQAIFSSLALFMVELAMIT